MDPVILAARTFLSAMHERRRETRLIDGALECIARLAVDPDSPGLNVEALYTSRGQQVYSARINQSFRLIFAWLLPDQIVLLYMDNHDEAYDWARAARDRVGKLIEKAGPWSGIRPKDVPPEIPAVDEDDLVAVRDRGALRQMLERGLVGYLATLSPDQRHLVEFDFRDRAGLMFIKGGAGTGKTAIAIRRLVHLAGSPELEGRKVQYLCFNRVLAETVRRAVRSLAPTDAAGEIDIATFHQWSGIYLRDRGLDVESHPNYRGWLQAAVMRHTAAMGLADELGDLRAPDIAEEIMGLIKPWKVASREEYLAISRVGTTVRLKDRQRAAIWRIFEATRPEATEVYDLADIPDFALAALEDDADFEPYRYLVVDEAQDCTPAMAELARAIVGGDDRRLMVLADPAQSIYANGFHIARRAFNPRGAQNVVLRVPYRSTQRVQAFARGLFADASRDERETIDLQPSPRTGELPVLRVDLDAATQEAALVAAIREAVTRAPGEPVLRDSVVLTTSNRARDHVVRLLHDAEVPAEPFDRDHLDLDRPVVKVATIHAAKGMEFPYVYVFDPASDDDEGAAFRNLLYVAFTRSSHALMVLVRSDCASPLLRALPAETYALRGSAAHLFTADA